MRGTAHLRADVVSNGCSRSSCSLSVLNFWSPPPAHFIIGLVWADRTEIVLFPALEARWEDLHAGKGVARSGHGSGTLSGATGLDGRGQTGEIFECNPIGQQDILTFYVSTMFVR